MPATFRTNPKAIKHLHMFGARHPIAMVGMYLLALVHIRHRKCPQPLTVPGSTHDSTKRSWLAVCQTWTTTTTKNLLANLRRF